MLTLRNNIKNNIEEEEEEEVKKNDDEKSIKCVGQILDIWTCKWSGEKCDFHEHFIRAHNSIEVFSQLQVSSVPFLNNQLLSAMTLVRAFDTNFIFYYHSSPEKKMIYFLIFLLDADDQPTPESFIYELMVKSPEEQNHCKVINYTKKPKKKKQKKCCFSLRFNDLLTFTKLFFRFFYRTQHHRNIAIQDEIRGEMLRTSR